MRHLMFNSPLLDPQEDGPNAGEAVESSEPVAEAAHDAGDGGGVDRGPTTTAAPAPSTIDLLGGDEDEQTPEPDSEESDQTGESLSDAELDAMLSDGPAAPAAPEAKKPDAPTAKQDTPAAAPPVSPAADDLPAELKPFLADDFGKELTEEFAEVAPIVAATKELAKVVAAQQKTIRDMEAKAIRATAAANEYRVNTLMDSVLDNEVYGNSQNGTMTDATYAMRVECEQLAVRLMERSKAAGKAISPTDALRMVQYRVKGASKPAAAVNADVAKSEAIKQIRSVSATRTPAGLRPGVARTKPATTQRTKSAGDDWANSIQKALA